MLLEIIQILMIPSLTIAILLDIHFIMYVIIL
jgi:hypothetical protein